MTGKGAIACTDPLSAGVFGRYDRIANGLIAEVRRAAGRGLQAGRDRDQALHHAAQRQDASSISTSSAEEFGRTIEPALALWGDVRERLRGLRRGAGRTTAAIHARQSALCGRGRRAHGGLA